MVSETITATAAAKAGMLASLVVLISNDLDLLMVLLVGFIGGLLFFFKKWTHLKIKTTKLKALSELLFTIPMSISTAGVVFYLGTNGINCYIDFGSAIWIFFALMASLHYETVVNFFSKIFSEMAQALTDVVVTFVKNKMGGKK